MTLSGFSMPTDSLRLLCPLQRRGSNLLLLNPGGCPQDPLPLHDQRPNQSRLKALVELWDLGRHNTLV